MSVVGSLSFTTRMAQPWLQYEVSRLQSVVKTANVQQLKYCNDVLAEAKEKANVGLFYRAGAFEWNKLVVLSIGDASWANETKTVSDLVFPRRSQYARIAILADPGMWDNEKGYGYYVTSKSGLIHRVCQSTIRAETHGQIKSSGVGWVVRAVLTQISGYRLSKNWENDSRKHFLHRWMTDCRSVCDYINNPIAAGCEDKRLEIDLEQLRQDM